MLLLSTAATLASCPVVRRIWYGFQKPRGLLGFLNRYFESHLCEKRSGR